MVTSQRTGWFDVVGKWRLLVARYDLEISQALRQLGGVLESGCTCIARCPCVYATSSHVIKTTRKWRPASYCNWTCAHVWSALACQSGKSSIDLSVHKHACQRLEDQPSEDVQNQFLKVKEEQAGASPLWLL